MLTSTSRHWLASACLALATAALSLAAEPYHLIHEIPVGGDGGWDYLSVDSAAHRLYVSHATKVVVIDLAKDEVVGEIADTPGIHGIALAPALHRAFTSHGRESKAGIVDLETLKTIAKVDTGENPDAILYEPTRREVYTFNGRGKSATIFAATTGAVVATLPLPGKPEFAVYDPAAGLVFNNIEDRNELVAINTKTHQLASTWPIAPGEEASGLAIDLEHHRLFLGCSNEMMVMMDSTNGKVVATVPIGAGVDATAFDPGTQLAFASSGRTGTVTIAREETPDQLTVVQTLTTESGARTMTIDPATHKIYLASAKFEPAPANPAPDAPRRRPAMIPGSFKILVYGMAN